MDASGGPERGGKFHLRLYFFYCEVSYLNNLDPYHICVTVTGPTRLCLNIWLGHHQEWAAGLYSTQYYHIYSTCFQNAPSSWVSVDFPHARLGFGHNENKPSSKLNPNRVNLPLEKPQPQSRPMVCLWHLKSNLTLSMGHLWLCPFRLMHSLIKISPWGIYRIVSWHTIPEVSLLKVESLELHRIVTRLLCWSKSDLKLLPRGWP